MGPSVDSAGARESPSDIEEGIGIEERIRASRAHVEHHPACRGESGSCAHRERCRRRLNATIHQRRTSRTVRSTMAWSATSARMMRNGSYGTRYRPSPRKSAPTNGDGDEVGDDDESRRRVAAKESEPEVRIPGIAITQNGASRSPVSRHRDQAFRRIAIGAKRRLSWGLVRSLQVLGSKVRGYRSARARVQSLTAGASLTFRREGPASAILWAPWRTRSQMASATVGSARKSCQRSCLS